MRYFYIYLFLINAAGFVLMLSDRRKAVKGRWRIPERTLIGVAVLGGSIGCLLGMNLFRHKTQHPKFAVGIPVIFAIQIVIAVLVCTHWA